METAKIPLLVYEYQAAGYVPAEKPIISESSVTLSVNGERWVTLSCSPFDLDVLSAGFLFTEGVIKSAQEIVILKLCDAGDNMDIWLTHGVKKPEFSKRASSCLGGSGSINEPALKENFYFPITFKVTPQQIFSGFNQLYHEQAINREASGMHSSALTDFENVFFQYEDIGRHNTIDKLAGHLLLHTPALKRRILITTGRISSEMILKSARMGVEMIVSRTSPTTASVQLADQFGISLIGYVRRGAFRVYTYPERLENFSLAAQPDITLPAY